MISIELSRDDATTLLYILRNHLRDASYRPLVDRLRKAIIEENIEDWRNVFAKGQGKE